MDGANIKAIKGAEKIDPSQHVEIVESADRKGKYWYSHVYGGGEFETWIGINKTGAEPDACSVESAEELIAWLNGEPEAPVINDNPFTDIDAEIDAKYAAKSNEADPFTPTSAAHDTPRGDLKDEPSMFDAAPATDAEAAQVPIDQLRRRIETEEENYFPLYGQAAILEAELKRRKQNFDKDNALLIADMKAAVVERDTQAKVLKALAKAYGVRTKEKQFDQYITFRENSLITWDEPEAIKWLEENFPAALIVAGVTVDEGRFKTYIRDCLKKKQDLPPSVKIDTEWETLLSSKIPVPELVGGAA